MSGDQIFLALCWVGAVGTVLGLAGWLAEAIERRLDRKANERAS